VSCSILKVRILFSGSTLSDTYSKLDAAPLHNIPLNEVPFVPNNEPLLGILDKFQEGRSHMTIVGVPPRDVFCTHQEQIRQKLEFGITFSFPFIHRRWERECECLRRNVNQISNFKVQTMS
jgi:hypothetical protein